MSLFSLGLLAAYFAGGMQYMMNQEGWDAADAFYFWSRAVWKSTSELGSFRSYVGRPKFDFHTGA